MKKDNRIILIVLFIVMIFALNIISKDTPRGETRLYGNPRVSTAYEDYRSDDVYQICDDGERIYILYNGQQGVIQVYDMYGKYQHTLLFYKHQNGAFSMAVHENELYVFDMIRNIYIFKNGEFTEFITYKEAGTKYKSLANHESSGDYQFRAGSIWRITPQGEYLIIKGPAPIVYYFKKFGIIAFALVIMFIKIKLDTRKNL